MGKFKTLKDPGGGVTVVRKDSQYDKYDQKMGKKIREKYGITPTEGGSARAIAKRIKLKDSIFPKEK